MNFYKENVFKIFISLQFMYYLTRENELLEEIKDIQYFLETIDENLLDNLTKQLMELLKDKLSKKYKNSYQRKKFQDFYNSNEFLEEYPVILSTTFSSKNSLKGVIYDYLIIDEASQVDIVTGALAMSCANNIVIVGDTKQLSNIVKKEDKKKAKKYLKNLK